MLFNAKLRKCNQWTEKCKMKNSYLTMRRGEISTFLKLFYAVATVAQYIVNAQSRNEKSSKSN